MKLPRMPTPAELSALGRHAATFAGGSIMTAAIFGLVSGDQASTLTQSLQHISDGVKEIAVGLGPVIGIVSGLYAKYTASPQAQINAVAATLPPNGQIITTPEVAAASPSPKVVAADPIGQMMGRAGG